MDPLTIAAGASIISGIGNFLSNSSASERASMMYNKNFQDWMALHVPNPEEQKVVLDKFVSQGQLDPKLEGAIKADPSQFQNIVTDTQQKASQMRALSSLEDIGNSGGLRLQDKAGLQESMMDAQVKDRAQRQGIAAEMQRKGAGGSGFEVAAQLQGQQGTADRMATNSLKTAGMAQDRALQAIMGSGDLATKYRGQDFNEQAQKASAADRINMFNTNNLQDVQQRNVGSMNRAGEMNLANAQRISDANTGINNQQSIANKNLLQQQYDNQIKQMQGASGQVANAATNEIKSGQNLGNTISNIGTGISNAYTADAKADADKAAQDKYYKYLDSYTAKR